MKFSGVPQELLTGVQAANVLLSGTENISVRFEKSENLTLTKQGDTVVIGYSRKAEALRGMSMVKRFWENPIPVTQKAKYDTLTLMADCSRNAVLTVQTVKDLMVQLAIMGFTSLMLYTEDTYEIPEQPYFGHMRGRYTAKELQELDNYGAEVGIELIPCMQTLAHLEAIFNWSSFAGVRDIDNILLVDNDETYILIEQMLKSLRSSLRSKYINIGMDEAHNLGRGAFVDRFGYEKKSDIMLRHLDKVVQLCKKYDFQPIMWSDMFFRMQFNGQYYVNEGELSEEVLSKIPEGVSQCYWDYYTPPKFEAKMRHMFAQHQRMQREIWFAGGSWKWSGVTPKNYFSNFVTPVHLKLAAEYGVKNIIATAWGDDGAECSVWAVMPSLLQFAELCYGDADEQTLDARSLDCFGLHYADMLKLDQVGKPEIIDEGRRNPPCLEKMALYNDVMLGILDKNLQDMGLSEKYSTDAQILKTVPHSRFDYLFDTQQKLAELLSLKVEISTRIKRAYRTGDKAALHDIVDSDIPCLQNLVDDYWDAFRTQWHRENKPFGFEVQDIRIGGIKARLTTAEKRLQQYLDGEIPSLEELEQAELPVGLLEMNCTDKLNSWSRSASACIVATMG